MDLSTRVSAHVVGPADDKTVAAESTLPEEKIQHAEPALLAEAVSAPAPDAGEDTSRKVLIVEDTTELAEVIAATLERIHIQSVHETHVERALEVYETYHPDVILLDIGLPDKTGWKLLDAIKAREEPNPPAVVVITAHGDPANRLMGKLQGVHSYLIKPFSPDEVEAVVGAALKRSTESGVSTESETATAEEEATEQVPLPEFIQELSESVTVELVDGSDTVVAVDEKATGNAADADKDAASQLEAAPEDTTSKMEPVNKDTESSVTDDIPETDVPLE